MRTTPPNAELIDYRKVKWTGALRWAMQLEVIETDEHGRWYGSWPGNQGYRGKRFKHYHFPFVMVAPHDGRYLIDFNHAHPRIAVYCDIGPVDVRPSTGITFVDLDLDVVRRPNGDVEVHDEDEFIAHITAFRYPDDTIREVRAIAELLVKRIEGGEEPFASRGPSLAASYAHRRGWRD
jgi:hypothetical protein